MDKEKKSHKKKHDELSVILDNFSFDNKIKDKYLKSLKNRLDFKNRRITLIQKEENDKVDVVSEEDKLKPKVVVHTREESKSRDIVEKLRIEIDEEKIIEQSLPDPIEEELFEIDVKPSDKPVFIQVKPVSKKEKIDETLTEWKQVDKPEEKINKEETHEKENLEWTPVEVKEDGILKQENIEIVKPQQEEVKEPEKTTEEQWEPVEEKEEKISEEIIETRETNICQKCGKSLNKYDKFCGNCGQLNEEYEKEQDEELNENEEVTEFITVEETDTIIQEPIWDIDEDTTIETQEEIKETKKTEEEHWEPVEEKEEKKIEKEEGKEAIAPEKKDGKNEISKEEEKQKIDVFKNVNYINEATALILIKHGYDSIDSIKQSTEQELKNIGIKRRKARKIKKEVEEIIDMNALEMDENIQEEETEQESVQIQTIKIDETAEGEITKEQIKKDEQQEIDHKIEAFKEIKSIDEETAIVLYDNGITSIETLIEILNDDLNNIKGINRKTAKKIQKDIEKIIKKKEKIKPIDINETSNGIIDEDKIIAEETIKNQDKKIPSPVELKNKESEWEPVEEEKTKDGFIPDKKTINIEQPDEWDMHNDEEEKSEIEIEQEIISEPKKENGFGFESDEKLDPFREFETIDNKTAIKLYNHGIDTIENLISADIKGLTKIKGIKKKQAIKIINEAKEKNKDNTSNSEDNFLMEDEEFIKDENITDNEITEEIKIEKEEDFFEEEPVITLDKKESPFEPIEIIDEKIEKLLIENNINSIEQLKDKTIKELTNIRGIRRKIAKQIKKEAEEIIIDNSKNDVLKTGENPFIAESEKEDNWELFEEEKEFKTDKTEEIGFRYREYTLYEKTIESDSGKKRVIRFFSKAEPEDAKPIQLPDNYQIIENKKTGVPYLKKKK